MDENMDTTDNDDDDDIWCCDQWQGEKSMYGLHQGIKI